MSVNAGTIVNSWATAVGTNVRGICCDYKYVIFSDNGNNLIYISSKKDGTIINSFATPAGFPDDIECDEKYLYVGDTSTDLVYQIERKTEVVVSTVDVLDTVGFTWDGRTYYVVGVGGKTIARFDRDGVQLEDAGAYDVAQSALTYLGNGRVAGVNFNQGDIFVKKFVDGDLSSGEYEIIVFNTSLTCTAVGFDSKYLSIVGTDDNYYKVML